MSSQFLGDPRGFLRGLGAPAAILRDGIVVAGNPSLRRLVGIDERPRPIGDVLAETALAETLAWMDAARDAGEPAIARDSKLRTQDGKEIEVELSYLPLAGTGGAALLVVRLRHPDDIQRDILEHMRRRYGEIIDSAQDPVVVHAIDGTILLANRAVQKLLGRPESDLLSLNIKDFIPARQHAAVRERAATRVAGISDRMYSYDVTVLDATGAERPLEISSAPILVEGEPVAVVVIGHFVDASPRRERLLRDQRDAAMASNQAKRKFLAHMSHEVRTPINVIFGMTEMALDTELPEEARSFVTRARDAAGSLLSLVEDVLEFSRVEARKYTVRPRPFDLRDRLQATVEGLASLARDRGLEVETAVSPSVPIVVVGDPDRLHQVLSNLLTNAIKFTPRGRVGVRVDVASAELPNAHHLRFAVFDTGVGLSVEQRTKIFDPFQQVHPERPSNEGTGLGLAIARELVGLLGGQIWVESQPGEGSTFHFDVVFERPAP